MPDGSDGSSGAGGKEKERLCDFCENSLRVGQKCSSCKTNYIHNKCLEVVVKAGKIEDKKLWQCKFCNIGQWDSSDSSNEDATIIELESNNEVITDSDVYKENDYLKEKVKLLNKIIKELENVNSLQKQRIEYLERFNSETANDSTATKHKDVLSYSGMVKKLPLPASKNTENTLIVKPVDKTSPGVTCEQVKQAVDPASLSIEVNKIITRKDGSLVINCKDKDSLNKLQSNIVQKIVSRENLSTRNSLILFFFTHGSSNDTLMTNDGTIEAKQMWKILGEHKDLQNKPKLFVFQACKGNDISTSFDKKMHENKHYSISSISLSDYPLPPDVLLCYSSVEGMKAYRNTVKGSWFIQEVCRNFMMYGRRDDVISLFTRVAKCVSTYTHIETKQMPSFISTLSRKFYLSKSKDRSNKIAIHEQYHKIYTALKEIETRIEIYEKNHNIK
ncbi:caspase [Holotrichia oblita]|uniref:Caspase n=1 Tax=Holotrichia oblita TaxID=644536 RepID=A0ACB9TUX9_HOLOL|nr:caspase [Holotrichia oblita]